MECSLAFGRSEEDVPARGKPVALGFVRAVRGSWHPQDVQGKETLFGIRNQVMGRD